MRVAILSDIHANFEALMAVAGELDAEKILVLGDFVGYGACPNEVIEWLRSHDCICVKGNHEQAVITGETSWFNYVAAKSILWTRANITKSNLGFLVSLEEKKTNSLGGVAISFMHGSPNNPLYEYVYEDTHGQLFEYYLMMEGANVIALGHTRFPFLWRSTRGTVLNPGSVGQPRDGDNRASFAILDIQNNVGTVKIHRVRYDIKKAAEKILAAGLPEMLAERLYLGR